MSRRIQRVVHYYDLEEHEFGWRNNPSHDNWGVRDETGRIVFDGSKAYCLAMLASVGAKPTGNTAVMQYAKTCYVWVD